MNAELDQACELLSEMKSDYGIYPHLSAQNIVKYFERGADETSVRAAYRTYLRTWRENLPKARELELLRQRYGVCQGISEEMVFKWQFKKAPEDKIALMYRNHLQHEEEAKMAQQLIARMQRELGVWDEIDEGFIFKALATNVNVGAIKDEYRQLVLKARAARIRTRILNELKLNPTITDISDNAILRWIEAPTPRTDDQIVALYEYVTVWALPRSTLVQVGIAHVRQSIYVAPPTSDS
ncbi:hypothetical protein EK21DRAFT_83426 [Setomelanomma holmii]|uniref:Uncharacterized protein n=1 Tax=Setomelanomma holmii TaxID=210430 RepID=A0A9P4HP04_9PLEO|nr:hypothetical protein EK21DRAFT_83426 [Setomelanomma holmii]